MKKILLTLLAVSLSGTVFAAEKQADCHAWCEAPVAHKFYISGMLGFGEGSGNSDLGFAFGGAGGYRINSNIAAEFDFIRTPQGTGSDTSSTYLFAGATKLSLPFSARLSGFAKLGLGVVDNGTSSGGSSSTRLGFLMGGGADYQLHPNLGVGGELLGTFGGTDAGTVAVLGNVTYTFGR